MTVPALIYGSLIAILLGSAFHLWKGGNLGRIILYALFSLIGFWAGHFVGNWLDISFWEAGPIRMGSAVVGSIVVLLMVHWLSQISVNE